MMFPPRESSCTKSRPDRADRLAGTRHKVFSSADLSGVIHDITAAMSYKGYGPKDVFALRLALEEAGVNAMKHGHRSDPTKPVQVAYHITLDEVLVEVEDEGPGFDPAKVPDPLAKENLERPCGRGLYLMRCYTTWLRFNERGNRITMCRRRSL
jgi:serine/threonine-protein kinase RsbW